MLKPPKLTVIVSIFLLTSATGCAVTNKLSKKFIQNPSTLALADHLKQKGAKCMALTGV
jgi:hypothetical protein